MYQETERIIATVDKEAAVYPGIDIDVPAKEAQKRTTPEDVLKSVKAPLSAGADGVVLSRRYSERKKQIVKGVVPFSAATFARMGSGSDRQAARNY